MTPMRAGLDDIIPFVVGAIWLIAQIAGAMAKKKRNSSSPFRVSPQDRPRPVQRDRREPVQERKTAAEPEDPFAEILRKMGGLEEFKVPEPQFVEELPEEHPWKPGEIETLPDVQPLRSFQSLEVPVAEVKKPEIDVDVRPKMSAFRSSVPTIKLSSMPSMNLRIDNPSYAEASRGRQGLGDDLHLNDRKALRRAMLSHIIFSQPKALEKIG